MCEAVKCGEGLMVNEWGSKNVKIVNVKWQLRVGKARQKAMLIVKDNVQGVGKVERLY